MSDTKMAMIDPVDLALQELLERGRGRKYLTWEEMNESLPDEAISPDKLEEIMLRLEENGIEMVDEAEADRLGLGNKDEDTEVKRPQPERLEVDEDLRRARRRRHPGAVPGLRGLRESRAAGHR